MRRSGREPDRSNLGTVTGAYSASVLTLERLFESDMMYSKAGWRSCLVLEFVLGRQSGSGSGKRSRMLSAHPLWMACVHGKAKWPELLALLTLHN